MILLSFLTITYNRSELIERLYNSIVDSAFKKDLYDWIVIVNGRNENLDTIKKLNSWKLENKINIKFYIIEVNKGLNRALNYFNNTSDSSYYVMRIDDDDILDPKPLLILINLLIEYKDNPNIGFILNMNDHFENLIGSELPNDK
jgi:glycosyltransferase involved in cell wall biosynthesis